MSEFVVATFNTHWGLSGTGDPFSLREAVAALAADVIALQEVWVPEGDSNLQDLADELGYQLTHSVASPNADFTGLSHGVSTPEVPGTWGLATLHRAPASETSVATLGRAPGDLTRIAQVVDLEIDERRVRIVNVHLTHRFPLGMQQLRIAISAISDHKGPTVVLGDFNLGRSLARTRRDLSPTVRGATFPSVRPIVQLDHILVSSHFTTEASDVVDDLGSDHRPARAVLRLA